MNLQLKSKKLQIEKEIHEFEDKKSEKIMELGMIVYDKVRNDLIDQSIFGEIIYEIRKIDLEIYNRMLDIANIEGHDENTPVCECGYIPKSDEKFCPKCGREIDREKNFMLCDVCASKIDVDSKFCVCCGSKVVKKQKFDIDEYESDDYILDDDNVEGDDFQSVEKNQCEVISEDIYSQKEELKEGQISDKIYIGEVDEQNTIDYQEDIIN
ncbi:MAG: zinc ribbon domain-containing protein [Intestinibacter sp.]|uniref:zinc ribbon domain-containing protein n=1 Tax=Intestinibacter sp. TaxID=1965304 RepID=UPI002A7FE53C|nr:zinc ribbon domain-containing protein [Intestinibacter sp.]MDY4573800.1 zinc ribbon domain-containing protein [Intestinibacter sp.]